jgi:hypothetical protein
VRVAQVAAAAAFNLLLVFAFLAPTRLAVAQVVREKELRLREGMRILGLQARTCRHVPACCLHQRPHNVPPHALQAGLQHTKSGPACAPHLAPSCSLPLASSQAPSLRLSKPVPSTQLHAVHLQCTGILRLPKCRPSGMHVKWG